MVTPLSAVRMILDWSDVKFSNGPSIMKGDVGSGIMCFIQRFAGIG